MPIIRKQLKPSDVYPEDMRYVPETDMVQRFVDGEWKDAPGSDPRRQTLFPPRVTSDTACDAAQSVVDAFKNQIDGILLAIDNGATAFAIAGTILGLFSFGPFGVLIGIALFIADQMLSAGTTALTAALTPEVYDQLVCILQCRMDNNGRLDQASFNEVLADVSAQIGGLAAGILNSMLNLAGFGGVNNLGALGSSTGDCSECDCGLCDLELWTTVYLGSVVEVGENYIDIASVNEPGVYGNHRAAIGTGDEDLCCCLFSMELLSGGVDAVYKYIVCGTPIVNEASYTINFPTTVVEVSTVAIDAGSPFVARFTFTACS